MVQLFRERLVVKRRSASLRTAANVLDKVSEHSRRIHAAVVLVVSRITHASVIDPRCQNRFAKRYVFSVGELSVC